MPSARRRTPAGVSGGRSIRRVHGLPGQLSEATRRGWAGSRASSRKVTTRSNGSGRSRRPEVPQQVEGRVVGPLDVLDDEHRDAFGGRGALQEASNTSSRDAASRTRSRRLPPISRTMSWSGASGRGVNRPSQEPHAQVASGNRPWSSSTSEVLPTPASPEIRTRRPARSRARRRTGAATPSCDSLSSRVTCTSLPRGRLPVPRATPWSSAGGRCWIRRGG